MSTENLLLGSFNWLYMYMPISDVSIFWPGLLIIGLITGIYGNGFGLAGAWIIAPGLNILGFSMPFAIGTSICQIAGMSLIFSLRQPKYENRTDYKLGLVMLLGAVVGIEAGLQIIMHLERTGQAGSVVRWAYLIILVVFLMVAIRDQARFPGRGTQKKTESQRLPVTGQLPPLYGAPIPPALYLYVSVLRRSVPGTILISLLTGMTAGFLGIGGGMLLLPALAYPIGLFAPVVMGTDLVEIVGSGMYGAFTYAFRGRVELLAVLVILVSSTAGELMGAVTSPYLSSTNRRLTVIATILCGLVSIGLKQAQYPYYATIIFLGGMSLICLSVIAIMIQGVAAEYRTRKNY